MRPVLVARSQAMSPATSVSLIAKATSSFRRGEHLPVRGAQGFRAGRGRQIVADEDAVGRVERHQGVGRAPAQPGGIALHDGEELGGIVRRLGPGAAADHGDGCTGQQGPARRTARIGHQALPSSGPAIIADYGRTFAIQ